MSTATSYAHIEILDGVPYVADTGTKVIQVVLDRVAYGWDADEIQRQHPYLTLGQIHSALAYYYDHKAELDSAIAEQERLIDEMMRKRDDTPELRRKLRIKGHVP